jgi:hypothetical protein
MRCMLLPLRRCRAPPSVPSPPFHSKLRQSSGWCKRRAPAGKLQVSALCHLYAHAHGSLPSTAPRAPARATGPRRRQRGARGATQCPCPQSGRGALACRPPCVTPRGRRGCKQCTKAAPHAVRAALRSKLGATLSLLVVLGSVEWRCFLKSSWPTRRRGTGDSA